MFYIRTISIWEDKFVYWFSWYGQTIHNSSKGEWNFDITKKPIDKIRVHGPSFSAINIAQQDLMRRGSCIKSPILLMCSNRSIKPHQTWRDEYEEGIISLLTIFLWRILILADLLLNVTTMRHAAATMGQNVTIYEIENAIHDIFLSKQPVREKAFNLMFRWLKHLEDDWRIWRKI
jgi:hypothetical protein